MSRSPDFILKALNKVTEHRSGKIGALWCNENGSMTLVLDVALLPDPHTVYTLFPNNPDDTRSHFQTKGLEARVAASMAMPKPIIVEPPKPRKRKVKMADLPVSARHTVDGGMQCS